MIRAVSSVRTSRIWRRAWIWKTRLGESGDVLIKFEIRVKGYTKELDMVGEGYGATGNIDGLT